MVYNKTDPDDALDFWIDTFVTIYDKHAPYKLKRVRSFPKPNMVFQRTAGGNLPTRFP